MRHATIAAALLLPLTVAHSTDHQAPAATLAPATDPAPYHAPTIAQPNTPAPTINATTTDRRHVSLARFRGKPLVLTIIPPGCHWSCLQRAVLPEQLAADTHLTYAIITTRRISRSFRTYVKRRATIYPLNRQTLRAISKRYGGTGALAQNGLIYAIDKNSDWVFAYTTDTATPERLAQDLTTFDQTTR